MSESSTDPERLAALLDGRLDDRARAALHAELARSDDALELLADAAAVLRELEREEVRGDEGDDEEAPEDPAVEVPNGPPRIDVAARGTESSAGLVATAASGVAASGMPDRVAGHTTHDAAHAVDAALHAAGVSRPVLVAVTTAPPGAVVGDIRPGADTGGREGWMTRGRWMVLAAAAVLLVAVVPWLWSRRAAGFESPAELIALVEVDSPSVGALGAPPWSVTRGVGDPLTAEARATRVGVRIAELELALRERDTAAVSRAGAVGRLLDEVPGGAAAAQLYRAAGARAGAPAESVARPLAEGWEATNGLLGAERVRLGFWLGAARVAAARRDTGFFRSPASRAMLERAAGMSNVGPEARAALTRVRAAAEPGVAPEWGSLGRDVEVLLATLGG